MLPTFPSNSDTVDEGDKTKWERVLHSGPGHPCVGLGVLPILVVVSRRRGWRDGEKWMPTWNVLTWRALPFRFSFPAGFAGIRQGGPAVCVCVRRFCLQPASAACSLRKP